MMQTSFRCFRSLPFFIFPKFTSLNFHLVVKHVHCFYVVFLSFGVDIIPYGVVFWVKKALFVSPRWSPPISAKISTSYTCRPGWLSGEQGDSDWAKRHLLNAKLMDRAMKAEGSEWMERLIFMLTCWDGWRLQKAQHVLHFWAKNGSQKNSFDVFFFFGGQKNESGCLPPCCWYSPTIHFSSFWSETSVGCILLQSHFFTSRILKYWDSCHSKGGFFFLDQHEFTLQVKQQLGMYLSKRLGSRSEKMAMGIFNPMAMGRFSGGSEGPEKRHIFFFWLQIWSQQIIETIGLSDFRRRNVIPKMGIAAWSNQGNRPYKLKTWNPKVKQIHPEKVSTFCGAWNSQQRADLYPPESLVKPSENWCWSLHFVHVQGLEMVKFNWRLCHSANLHI